MTMLLMTLGAADVELQAWVDEGRTVPDERVGKLLQEIPNQVSEFSVMARVRTLQEELTQAQLDEQADHFAARGADQALPVEVRRRALFTACHFQRSQTVPTLVGAAASGPLQLRMAAVMCLGRYGNFELIFERELQKGEERQIRFRTHFSEAAYRAALVHGDSPSPEVRGCAWQALSHFENPEVGPLVGRMMKRGESSANFLRLLSAFPSREVTAYLTRFAKDPSVEVRRMAAFQLANRAAQVPRALLMSFLADPDDAVSTSGLKGLRWQLRLPMWPNRLSLDRRTMARLFTQRFSPGFRAAPLDKTMPPEVDQALELRKAGRSAEAADRLVAISRKAVGAQDFRTAAIALHRAGDAFADDRDCNGSVDAYWQAMVMHELRGDLHFAGVAANDLGLLWFQCGWDVGPPAPELFEYVVSLRRATGDQEGLRKALNNLSTALLGILYLDDAAPVIAETLALSRALGDPVAERKALTNEASRLALYCTELVRLRVRDEDGDGLGMPPQCVRRPDGTVGYSPETEVRIRQLLKLAVAAARKTNIDNATLCSAFGMGSQRVLCELLPKEP